MERFFPKDKLVKTGNPVRNDLLDITRKRADSLSKYDLTPNAKTILVIGGSLGARAINQLISTHLDFFKKQGVQLLWQTGKLYHEQYKHHQSQDVQVMAYIDAMDMAYAAADVIVSRAGASSVSELCIVGKATIFIPSPNVAEDHQTKNAEALTSKKAGILIKESNAKETFGIIIKELFADEAKCNHLGENIKKLALPGATNHIVDEVEKLLPSLT
jgi:UDP-N-acetylglucosamine--N-acetylmuramyl-(pentapeptide) pyrophosphoryl-undecaprenol N-acetylglucosamine transferase